VCKVIPNIGYYMGEEEGCKEPPVVLSDMLLVRAFTGYTHWLTYALLQRRHRKGTEMRSAGYRVFKESGKRGGERTLTDDCVTRVIERSAWVALLPWEMGSGIRVIQAL